MNSIVLVASESLRLVFDYRGDRWGHRIEVDRDGEWIAALSSIEGSPADDWPPSPAFQHIHLQTFSINGPTALLVGKAGPSHWSAAIEADRESAVLRFDIACRLAGETSFLGSSYSLEIMPLRAAVDIPSIRDDCRRLIESDERRLAVRIFNGSGALPATTRWKYVISLPSAAYGHPTR